VTRFEPAIQLPSSIANHSNSEMGSDMITFYVGKDNAPFSVHKNLICAAGKPFASFFGTVLEPGERYAFEDESPAILKLFIEYLYTKRIPTVHVHALPIAKSLRLKDLCQLYAFAEKYRLENEVSLAPTRIDLYYKIKNCYRL
jgi:hypothetical protein